jgi:hypothetical protein
MESKTSKEIRNPERNKKELETEKPETQMNLEQRETGNELGTVHIHSQVYKQAQ